MHIARTYYLHMQYTILQILVLTLNLKNGLMVGPGECYNYIINFYVFNTQNRLLQFLQFSNHTISHLKRMFHKNKLSGLLAT